MQKLKDELAYQGAIFTIHEQEIILNDKKIERQVMKTSDSITLALVNDQNEVLIVNEYRSPLEKFAWSLPAGRVDPDEAPLVTARRELAEETGYLIDNDLIHEVDHVSLSSGVMDEHAYIFVAHLTPGRFTKTATHFDFDEEIQELQWLDVKKALSKTDGAASHIALLHILLDNPADLN